MDKKNQEPLALWSYIALDKFLRPPMVKTEATRRGALGIWKRLKRTHTQKIPLITHEVMQPLSPLLLDELTPPVEWNGPVSALIDTLKDWLNTNHINYSGHVIVGAPHNGASEIVTQWAISRNWFVVQPPSWEQVLRDDSSLLVKLENTPIPVVVPYLERWYLRHAEGLSLIKRLLDWLQSSHRHYLVACDSWAWAYLSGAFHINTMFPPPLALEAFDHERLQFWFRTRSTSSEKKSFIFKQTDNEEYVLKPPDEILELTAINNTNRDISPKPIKTTDFLKNLAAYCRGNPEIARKIWRSNLQFVPDEKLEIKSRNSISAGSSQVIWVKPWSQLNLPSLNDRKQINLLVLHTLLIHGGLPVKTLNQLLPFSQYQISQTLHSLFLTGFVEINRDMCRVTPIGYPSIRESLDGEGYMVDAL